MRYGPILYVEYSNDEPIYPMGNTTGRNVNNI